MDDASTKVFDRASRAPVSKEDVLEFVREMAKRSSEDRDFEGRAVLLASLHTGNPDKALAIEFRMEALARLFGSMRPKGWALPPGPDGTSLTAEPVFAAAAVHPMIEKDGRPAFERTSFLEKVLELASTAGSA